MLTSILPVVHRDTEGRGRRAWLCLAALYSAATLIAAAAIGALLASAAWAVGGRGTDLSAGACWSAALVALLYLPRQLGWTRLPPLVQSTRQVPREWAYDYPRWITALLFGLGLGNGCYTRIVTPAFYLLWVWPFLVPGFLWPVAIWACYGLARSGTVWWLACSAPVGDPIPHASKLAAALLQGGRCMRRANALVLLVVACWLLAGSQFR